MSRTPDEIAVVLSGGGAYGAFGIGVLKVLFAGRSPSTRYQALEPNIFTGTSVGSFNAALLAGYRGSNLDATLHLETVWTERVASAPGRCGNGVFRVRGNPIEYADADCIRSPNTWTRRLTNDTLGISEYFLSRTANFFASSLPVESRAMGLLNAADLLDNTPLYDLLRATINPADVFHSTKRLRIVATNWVTGNADYFSNADFQGDRGFKAIMASTAIPGVFPPVAIDQNACVDGGVVENTPLNPAIKMGATELHVIYLNPDPRLVPLQGQPSTIDTILRVYFMMLSTKMDEDIKTAKWINEGLEVIERFQKGRVEISSTEASLVARVASRIFGNGAQSLKKIIVHRYFPRKSLGNELGMLDFGRETIIRMIQEGETVALKHDCQESDCALIEE
jgi:predicted acylesterase/phospholipase RssA